MLEELKNIKSGKKELRDFGLVIGVGLAAVGVISWFLDGAFYYAWLNIGAVLVLLGLLIPFVLKPFQKIWMTLAMLTGWVMTHLVLVVVYYGMVTPIGIVGRIFGKEFLDVSFHNSRVSYWRVYLEKEKKTLEYERQF